jgi:AcrR family transcriptional regulator
MTKVRSGERPDANRTRQRILAIALELFSQHGYAGTSIADIAGRLGTSKAALYYHFGSKAEIIEALLARPLATYADLVEGADRRTDEDLLGAVVQTTAELHEITTMIGNDPSMRSALQGDLLARSREINHGLTTALAGPRPDPAAIIRAHAAYAVVKNGTLAIMSANGGRLSPAERAELRAAALRALHPESTG